MGRTKKKVVVYQKSGSSKDKRKKRGKRGAVEKKKEFHAGERARIRARVQPGSFPWRKNPISVRGDSQEQERTQKGEGGKEKTVEDLVTVLSVH